jgi:hypothetical protein
MAYGETNLKQYMISFLAENVEEVNKEFVWFLVDNRDIRVDRCEYDEGVRWTSLRVFYSTKAEEDKCYD